MSDEKKRRGFALLTPEQRRELAARGGRTPRLVRTFSNREFAARAGRTGGRAVPAEKRGFRKDREFAAECGRKGGRMVDPENRTFTRDRGLAMAAGRKGGLATQARMRTAREALKEEGEEK